MNKRKKSRTIEIDATLILLVIIFLVTIAVNLKVLIDKFIAPATSNKLIARKYEELIEERDSKLAELRKIKNSDEIYQEELAEVKKMAEKKRMTFYFSKFITYIEEKDYGKAYSILYDEFKQNYFPTYESFKEYAEKKYPDFMRIEHTYMSRQGEYYILTVDIYDLLTNKLVEEQQRYVIKENDFYDYALSFEVR